MPRALDNLNIVILDSGVVCIAHEQLCLLHRPCKVLLLFLINLELGLGTSCGRRCSSCHLCLLLLLKFLSKLLLPLLLVLHVLFLLPFVLDDLFLRQSTLFSILFPRLSGSNHEEHNHCTHKEEDPRQARPLKGEQANHEMQQTCRHAILAVEAELPLIFVSRHAEEHVCIVGQSLYPERECTRAAFSPAQIEEEKERIYACEVAGEGGPADFDFVLNAEEASFE